MGPQSYQNAPSSGPPRVHPSTCLQFQRLCGAPQGLPLSLGGASALESGKKAIQSAENLNCFLFLNRTFRILRVPYPEPPVQIRSCLPTEHLQRLCWSPALPLGSVSVSQSHGLSESVSPVTYGTPVCLALSHGAEGGHGGASCPASLPGWHL